MGADTGTEESRRGRAGRHRRRTGRALIERRDHEPPRRPRRLPAPSPSALVGLAVLVLIGIGVVHLSGSGSAVPLETAPTMQEEASPGDAPDEGATAGGDDGAVLDHGTEPADGAAPEDGAAPVDGAAAERGAGTELVVHVSGAVAAPGLVHLPPGARIDDALRAAGGALDEADLSAINLARPLVDGEQIHVPVPGEEPRADPAPVAAGGADEQSAAGGDGAPIDLNTASVTELEELPGVGPSIAARIVEHRERNGPFTSVEGLLEVSGIGPATLEEIRDRATV